MLQDSLCIFIGGGLGAVLRYWMSRGVHRFWGSGFPLGTLAVNLLGCFLIGFWMTLMAERFLSNPRLRLFLTIGFLGGLTTFSTFSYETLALIEGRSFWYAGLNILGSLAGCLSAVWLGYTWGKAF